MQTLQMKSVMINCYSFIDVVVCKRLCQIIAVFIPLWKTKTKNISQSEYWIENVGLLRRYHVRPAVGAIAPSCYAAIQKRHCCTQNTRGTVLLKRMSCEILDINIKNNAKSILLFKKLSWLLVCSLVYTACTFRKKVGAEDEWIETSRSGPLFRCIIVECFLTSLKFGWHGSTSASAGLF